MSYVRLFGREIQTYATNGKTAQIITGYQTKHGGARYGAEDDDGLRRPLFNKEIDKFPVDYMSVLAIFFTEHGVYRDKPMSGKAKSGSWFTATEKRDAMLHGLVEVNGGLLPGNTKAKQANGKALIFGKVFENDPRKAIPPKEKQIFKMFFESQDNATYWEDQLGEERMQAICKLVPSMMHVWEWCHTPWHLHHLPFQKQNAVFSQGEAFNVACNRCSRFFYESKFMYYTDEKGATHLPNILLKPLDDTLTHEARIPLHDKQFWPVDDVKDKPVVPQRAAVGKGKKALPVAAEGDVDESREAEQVGQVWPRVYLRRDNLHRDDRKRLKIFRTATAVPFRRHESVAYGAGIDLKPGQSLDSDFYDDVTQPQGYMTSTEWSKLNFRVTRSHKFGNCCQDCRSVLTKAPGLFVNNHRHAFGADRFGDIDADHYARSDPDIFNEKLFDQLFVPLRTQHEQRRDEISERELITQIQEKLRERYERQLPANYSKIVKVDIAIGSDPRNPTTRGEEDASIAELIKAIMAENKNITLEMNATLRNGMRQLQRQMQHTRDSERAKRIKFEAGIMRDEYRNCIIRVETDKEGIVKFIWLNPPPNYCKEFEGYATHTLDTSAGGRYLWDAQESGLEGCNVLQVGDYPGRQTVLRTNTVLLAPDTKTVFYNCLLTRQFDPRDKKNLFRVEVYLSTARKSDGRIVEAMPLKTMWRVDQLVAPYDAEKKMFFRAIDQGGERRVAWHQRRELRQTRVFITYSLHRPITGKQDGEDILAKMADAIHHLFGDDTRLSKMLVFGRKLAADAKSNDKMWVPISKARKEDYVFYGGMFDVVSQGRSRLVSRNSYVYDQFDTHVENVDVDGGVEIGPTMGHPHFHVMLTLTHFSYLQFDYYAMKYYLETLFKGLEGPEGTTMMLGNETDPFYGDNENPYVEVKLYPSDNFLDALHSYVRKHAVHDRVNDARDESNRRKPDKPGKRRDPARDSSDDSDDSDDTLPRNIAII
jgi:hypothetical protein